MFGEKHRNVHSMDHEVRITLSINRNSVTSVSLWQIFLPNVQEFYWLGPNAVRTITKQELIRQDSYQYCSGQRIVAVDVACLLDGEPNNKQLISIQDKLDNLINLTEVNDEYRR